MPEFARDRQFATRQAGEARHPPPPLPDERLLHLGLPGLHLVLHPGGASRRCELVLQLSPELFQMADVVEGVFELRRRERPLPPVGAGLPLVGRQIQETPHDRGIARGIVVIDEARGHLHVEERRGPGLDRLQDEAHLLAAGMHDCGAAGLGEQPPERVQLLHLERVDHRERVGGSNLDQAELAAIGVFRHEFGVEGDVGVGGEPIDERSELRLGRDQIVAIGRRVGGSHAGGCRGVRGRGVRGCQRKSRETRMKTGRSTPKLYTQYPKKLGIFTPDCSAIAFTMKLGPLPM